MASIVVNGDTSGSVTLSAPAVSGSSVLTLPAVTDTVAGIAATQTLTNKTLTSPTLTTPALGTPTSGILTSCTGINYEGLKNRIINGAMVIDQRNAGASVTPTGNGYTLDRWRAEISQSSKFSVQQNAGSVTPPTGFTKYLGITSLSAYSIVAGDYFQVRQAIEGNNIADLGWGAAGASAVTLSFQVRSSLTGTFGGAIQNADATRSYPFTYTISSANTWTSISLTIAGDTTGTWQTGTSGGIYVYYGFGVGSTYSGTAGAWAAANYLSATGAVSVVGTNAATFYITGVQLEKGSTATSFDYRPFGTELALCQRYFCKSFNQSVAPASNAGQAGGFVVPAPADTATDRAYLFAWRFPVSMRAAPTVTTFNPTGAGSGWYLSSGASIAASTANAGTEGVMVTNNAVASANQNAVIHLTASAEL